MYERDAVCRKEDRGVRSILGEVSRDGCTTTPATDAMRLLRFPVQRFGTVVWVTETSVLLAWLVGGAAARAELPPTGSTPESQSVATSVSERQLQEVTVTANRRQESNQQVPAGITAITGDTAEKVGVTDAQSLAAVVPGLLFTRQGNASTPFLRGVGNPVGESGDESSVALYVDDVYIPSGSASLANFTSIHHIEVEKGPQGTLFGRNATGGVVQVFTRSPTDKPELEFTAGYGNYDTWSANMYASGPLAPQLLANVSVYWSNQSEGRGVEIPQPGPRLSGRAIMGRESNSSGMKATGQTRSSRSTSTGPSPRRGSASPHSQAPVR